ncbi:MAG TPA: GGDEF domain-containing protein [Planctomycetota bacterium]|nr:GGDEF domain-containing protein [Planctomycetota bacterium]
MGDGLRTLRLVTNDESLLASTRAAAAALEGFEFQTARSVDELMTKPPNSGDVILLDNALRSSNVYEACRALTGKTRCRTFIVVQKGNTTAESIAHFCGATGVLERPLNGADLRKAIETNAAPRAPLAATSREKKAAPVFPEAMFTNAAGDPDAQMRDILTDPDTGLFNFAYLKIKLDEEYKRSARFGHPLSCVMLGFDGQLSDLVLRELASIFLDTSRDTDVLGRFDENSFLFLLPHTGPDGAQVMAKRVQQMAQEKGLCDVVGDRLEISVGIAFYPHAKVQRREDLYSRTRQAFLEAQAKGGAVVTGL